MMDRRMERRREVDMILNLYQDGLPVLARAWDVSVTGMRLVRVLNPTCRPDELVELEFQLPHDPEVFSARGRCVYAADDNGVMGIHFLDADEHLVKKLRSYIEGYSRGRAIN